VLCDLDALPPGSARGFDPGGTGADTLFAVNSRGGIRAYLNRCPHDGATPLPWRRHAYLNQARDRIVCSAHGAEFLIGSGECVLGPCLGRTLSPVPVHVRDGRILLGTEG
jgi:nitrite reductase/ring-hydroxylating ferredoxin subunit